MCAMLSWRVMLCVEWALCPSFRTLCHAVLRLPGESSGADCEVVVAERMGLPVMYDLEVLRLWLDQEKDTAPAL